MMNYGMMSGAYGGGPMTLGWLIGLLVLADLALGAVALWKYINKK